jgi:vacuolar-type H+-ATPase subunit I/STV1
MFAGVMMLILGLFHAFQGLIALFQQEYYLVAANGLTVHVDYSAWGWTHLIFGIVVIAAGAALLVGQMWARVVAVVLAVLSAVVNAGFLAAYPVWSAIMIAVDILVIWALTVHGSEMRTRNEVHASFQ